MKHIILFFLLVPLLLNAQISEDCEKVMSFNTVQIYDGIMASLERGDDTYICPGANTRLEDLKISLENGALKVRIASGVKLEKAPVIKVIYKELRQIEGFSKADIDTRNLLKTDSLKVLLRSGAKLYADLDIDYFEYEASEGGLLKARGYAVEQYINVSVKATFSGFELEGEHGNVKSTTGAVAKINMEKKVNAHASTGGQIRYRSNPSMDEKTSMGGKIIKDEED